MGFAVEHLRVHALPPFSLAIGDRLQAVVRNSRQRSGLIALVADRKKLIPGAVRCSVIAHSKSQSIGTRNPGPSPNNVALRANVNAIPRLMFRIPAVEVVV